MTHQTTCCLCSQIAGSAEHDLISRALKERTYVRRVPIESEHFAVIPSVGPLAPGHSLLCPIQHVKSIAQIPADAETEFRAIKELLQDLLQRAFGAPVHCFEHGSSPANSRVLCTVDHAHLHFVPA